MTKLHNKRERPSEMQWIKNNFKDLKLQAYLYLQLGVLELPLTEEHRKKILGNFENMYDEVRTTSNTVTKAALMLKKGLVDCGYHTTNKKITNIYNLASNVLTHKSLPLIKNQQSI
jgi:hypothetical protein